MVTMYSYERQARLDRIACRILEGRGISSRVYCRWSIALRLSIALPSYANFDWSQEDMGRCYFLDGLAIGSYAHSVI